MKVLYLCVIWLWPVLILLLTFQIRPLFEEHGNVIEVALIKDRRTGQQRGIGPYFWYMVAVSVYHIQGHERLMEASLSSSSISVCFATSWDFWFLFANTSLRLINKTSNMPWTHLCMYSSWNLEAAPVLLIKAQHGGTWTSNSLECSFHQSCSLGCLVNTFDCTD